MIEAYIYAIKILILSLYYLYKGLITCAMG